MGADFEGIEVTKEEADVFLLFLNKSMEAAGFGFTQIDVTKNPLPEELRNAFKVVIPWMRRMAGQAEGEVRAAIMLVAAHLQNEQSGRFPSPNPEDAVSNTAKAMTDEEKEAERKAKEEAAKKAAHPNETEDERKAREAKEAEEEKKKAAGKKQFPPMDDDEENKGKKKEKSLSLDDPDAILNMATAIVQKGRKAMTSERAKTLGGAASQLLLLLKETDEDAFQEALAQINKELPSNTKVDSQVRPVGVGTVPPGAMTVVDASKTESEELADLKKRIAEIEKSRSPSTSVDGDGNGNADTKVEKSFWSGVL